MKLLWAQKQYIESTAEVFVDRAIEAAGALVGTLAVSCIPADRTGTIPSPVEIAYDPIPEPDDTLKLHDLMYDRADELIIESNEESGGMIDVYWSGGVDSTAALIALIKRLGEEANERLTIWLTENSAREYPLFWRQRQSAFRFIHIYSASNFNQPHEHFSSNQSPIKITGECGDQLHGSARYYLQGAEADVQALLVGPHGEKLIEQAQNAPYRLSHWRDWLWWWNFSLKWVSVCWRISSLGRTNALHHKAFFRTEKFQAWAQANPDLRADRPYRQKLKKFIEVYTGDAKYTKNKGKIGSLETARGPLVGAILEDGSYLPYGDPRISDFIADLSEGN